MVQRLGKPWYQRRALRVFRDDTSLSATPSLWPSIEQALGNSRFLVLLASPEAATSSWVNKEVSYWLDNKSADTLLIALTDGNLAWDNAVGDFVRSEGMPLPPALIGRFASEPKWVDLRAYRAEADARDSHFIEAGADLAATIRGMPKEDLLSQEVRQQRRALRLALTAVALLFGLAAVSIWQGIIAVRNERIAVEQRDIAEQQTKLAQEQRNRAERNLSAATNAANGMVLNLAGELRDRTGIPIEMVRDILDRARTLQRQLTDAGENTPNLRLSEAIALLSLSDTIASQGDIAKAIDFTGQARAIFEELVKGSPQEWRNRIYLVATYNRLAELYLDNGRTEIALELTRNGLAIRKQLSDLGKDDAQSQLELSDSLERVGVALAALGKASEALELYLESETILQRLIKILPDSEDKLHAYRSLAHRQRNISLILQTTGRIEEAEKYLRDSVAIREIFVKTDPTNTENQANLAASLGDLGIFMRPSRPEESLALLQKVFAIFERLSALDKGNVDRQRDLSISHVSIGDTLLELNRYNEAAVQFQAAAAIREKLVSADPRNLSARQGLAIVYGRLGVVLNVAGRDEEALTAFRRALAINLELVKTDPANNDYQGHLASGYSNVGDQLFTMSRYPESLDAFLASISIAARLSDIAIPLWSNAADTRLSQMIELGRRAIAAGRLTTNQMAFLKQAIQRLDGFRSNCRVTRGTWRCG